MFVIGTSGKRSALMPKLSIYIIRTSLVYLIIGVTIGALLLSQKATLFYPKLWLLLPVHVEVVLFGWILQLIIGVSFWMLPRLPGKALRGNEALVWGSFILLNGGILLACGEPFFPDIFPWGFAGRLCQMAAIILYARHAWPRIRPFGDTVVP